MLNDVFGVSKSCGSGDFGGIFASYLLCNGVSASCGYSGVIRDKMQPSGNCSVTFGCVELEDGFRTTSTDSDPLTIPCTHFGTP